MSNMMDSQSHKVNNMELKHMNYRRIFNYLYSSGVKSKQDIAYALNMSIPTVARNVDVLQKNGLVKDAGMMDSTGGRKAQGLVFDPTAKYAVGLDITRNHVGCGIVDLHGNLSNSARVKLRFCEREGFYRSVGDLVDSIIENAGIEREKVLGVGIAVPAIVSEDGERMTYAHVLGKDTSTLARFREHIAYECMLFNDANSAGFAEMWKYKSEEEDLIYLSLNNSVGGSVIRRNTLCKGKNQRAGEFGHMCVVSGGAECYCGQKGCLDVYCNAKLLSSISDGKLSVFFDKLRHGEDDHVTVWDKYLNHLATALNNLRMAFDCDVIIGGYVGVYMDEYINRLQELAAEKNPFEKDGGYIKACRYKYNATAVGAALHYIDAYLKSL